MLWWVCCEWSLRQEIPADISEYQNKLLNDSHSPAPSSELGVLLGTAAVETALVHLILNGKIELKTVFNRFSNSVIIRVWDCILRPGFSQKRGKLLSALLDISDVLSKILKNISDKSKHVLPPDENAHYDQWLRMRFGYSRWTTALLLVLLSVIICISSTLILYTISDLSLKVLIEQRGWILIILSLIAFLIPFPIIRYLTVLFPLVFAFVMSKWLLISGEKYFYLFIPTLAIAFANEIINKWKCCCCVYPAPRDLMIERFKAVGLFLAGSAITSLFLIFMISFWTFWNDDFTYRTEENVICALKNYSEIMKWPDHPSSLNSHTLWEKLNVGWGRSSMYQDKLLDRFNNVERMYKTSMALEKFGYQQEAAYCQHLITNYLGWEKVINTMVDGKAKTIYLDEYGNQISAAIVVTSIAKGGQAETLGMDAGDIIQSIKGNMVTSPEDLTESLSGNVEMDPISIIVRRDKDRLEFQAKPVKLGIIYMVINAGYLDK
ncbi:MAG: hypothetical protein A4E55_01045 [Pelotomaculum sp. PtaU1.Bin035]|nr:MAG: hypothetical protein A4E55_01045 [Pelotomaculum sp. PtaU1.Bin035]